MCKSVPKVTSFYVLAKQVLYPLRSDRTQYSLGCVVLSLMIKRLGIVCSIALMLSPLMAQVQIDDVPDMRRVVSDYAALFPAEEEIEGWSILVALNRDRRKFDQIQAEFRYRYPEFREFIEWRFENPYYKLIVGAFADIKSAQPLLQQIRKNYSSAFEVRNTFPRQDIMRFRRRIEL